MPRDEVPKKPQPRLSFTAKHTREGVVVELLMLLETASRDGKINEEETWQIGAWLHANGADSSIPGMEFLRTTVREILSDGRVTREEREALYLAVEKILPPELRQQAKARRTTAEKTQRERNRPFFRSSFVVKGVTFEGRAEIIAQFAAAGQNVFLVREPDNKYDPNAILIRLGPGYDIGHVPRDHAAALAKLLDIGCIHRARITKICHGRICQVPVIDVDVFNADAEDIEGLGTIPARSSPPTPQIPEPGPVSWRIIIFIGLLVLAYLAMVLFSRSP